MGAVVTRRLRGALFAALLVALALPAAASAVTYTVTSTSDSTNPCNGTACPSLRSAVAAANAHPGSIVQLGAGTFTLGSGPGAPVGTGELQVFATMTIAGVGQGATVIKQTDNQNRVLNSWNPVPSITLQNLTLTGGHLNAGASQAGGAIYTLSPMTLDHVAVTGNVENGSDVLRATDCCQSVGAIVSVNTLTLTNSQVTNNRAIATNGADASGFGAGGAGGQSVAGILVAGNNQVTITNSTISGNTAVSGAGGNSTSGAGGAGGYAYGGLFLIDNAPLRMLGSRLSGNSALAGAGGRGGSGGTGGSSYGAGLFSPDGTININSSTFDGNSAIAAAGGQGTGGRGGAGGQSLGGGVAGGNRLGTNAIVNSTFNRNEARAAAGGQGSPNGGSGFSAGGGFANNTDLSVSLVSNTFADNSATGPGATYGGNLYDQFSSIALAQNIFSGGTAGQGSNCTISAAETDFGYNLESTSPSGCGLSAAHGDLIGADANLAPLADNGGPAPTMALSVGSAALGAGGTCRDYTRLGNPLLTTDERGLPRLTPCDIGAFQTQPGSPPPPAGSAPRLTAVRQSAARWRAGSALAHLAARRHKIPVGTTFSFTLDQAANIELRFTRLLAGRKHGGRCVAVTKHNRHAHPCTRTRSAGTISLAGGRAGPNKVRFQGRLSRTRRLGPGSYTVTIVAVTAGGRTTSRRLKFTIVR